MGDPPALGDFNGVTRAGVDGAVRLPAFALTGGHRRRILRIRLLRRAYWPVLAQAHVALKPPATPPK